MLNKSTTPKFLFALLRYNWEHGNVRELADTLEQAIDRTSKDDSELTIDLLDLQTFSDVGAIDERECEIELFQILRQVYQTQGLEKGNGLYQRIAETLGCSNAKVTGIAKEAQ